MRAAWRIFSSSPSGKTTRFSPVRATLVIWNITRRVGDSFVESLSRYSSMFTGLCATPLSIAAAATAGATQ